MKKRLRKKRHMGEFQELGFEVVISLIDKSLDSFLDSWVVDAIDKHGLNCGGGGTAEKYEFIVCRHNGTCSDHDKELIEIWLKGNKTVTSFTVGPFIDMWNGCTD